MISDFKQIGVGLTGFGSLFLLLGIILLFDKAFLVIGNVLFIAGIIILIGPQRVAIFFGRPGKRRGSACFLLGVVLVLWGWCITGMLIELFGIVNLFGNFFQFIIPMLRNLPIIGNILETPIIARILDRFHKGTILPMHEASA